MSNVVLMLFLKISMLFCVCLALVLVVNFIFGWFFFCLPNVLKDVLLDFSCYRSPPLSISIFIVPLSFQIIFKDFSMKLRLKSGTFTTTKVILTTLNPRQYFQNCHRPKLGSIFCKLLNHFNDNFIKIILKIKCFMTML